MRVRLKVARQKQMITQEKAASLLDISISYYRKIESGQRNPTLKLAMKIAALFGEKVDVLLEEAS